LDVSVSAGIPIGEEQLMDQVLDVSGLEAGYYRKRVVFGLDIDVSKGEIVTILGHNGAGKTTTLKAISGLIRLFGGKIVYKGKDVTWLPCAEKTKRGITFIPSEHFTFAEMTVMDNLRLGGRLAASPAARERCLERNYQLFPVLAQRSKQKAGTLSGGEQRMLSIAIVLMSEPTLLLLDEPSLGLAPVLAHEIFMTIKGLVQEEGLSVLLVEQNVALALEFADRAYIMRSGRFILHEKAKVLSKRKRLWDLF
jgi:branched-chain amino acid transport system ATP-binding protein